MPKKPTKNNVTPQAFAKSVFGSLDGVVAARHTPDGKWRTAWLKSTKTFAGAWYIGIARYKHQEGYIKRGRDEVIDVAALVLDDIGTKVDPKLIKVKPSWVMETSKGNFQYGYILDEPCEKMAFEAIVNGFIDAGLTDPGASGCYRVVRLPGSLHKTGFEARLTWRGGAHDIQDLVKAHNVAPRAVKAKKSIATDWVGDIDVVDNLYAWIQGTNRVINDDGGAWVQIDCPNAAEHTTGDNQAGYSPLGRGEGEWVLTRGFKCLHAHCVDLHFKDLMASYLPLGAPWCAGHDPLPWLQHRFAIVAGGGGNPVFVDTVARGSTIWKYAPNVIAVLPGWRGKMFTPDRVQPVGIPTAFKEHRDTTVYNDFGYLPGNDIDIVSGDQVYCNNWVPLSHPETNAVPTEFLKHVAWLVPDKGERELFLDWLGFKLQFPAMRSFAIMMVTDETQGVGRTLLGNVVKALWGEQARSIDLAQLLGIGYQNSNYNHWMSGTQMVLINEMKDIVSVEDSYHAYTTFKERVDNDPGDVDIKRQGIVATREKIWFNALIFSNHTDALILPEDDRRLMVIRNPDTPMDPDEGARLAVALPAETAAVYWYLMKRTKRPPVKAPMTDAKMVMIEQTASGSDRIKARMSEIVPGDIITKKDFKHFYDRACTDEDVSDKTRETQFAKLWMQLPHLKTGQRNGIEIRFDKGREICRCFRNTDKWRRIYANTHTPGVQACKEEAEKNFSRTDGKPNPFSTIPKT